MRQIWPSKLDFDQRAKPSPPAPSPKVETSREMPFASGDAHSAARKRSEAPPDAEASSPFGRLSERSQLGEEVPAANVLPFEAPW